MSSAAQPDGPAVQLPRVGNRADFSPSFKRSRWSEDHTIALIQQGTDLVAVHYGASRTAETSGVEMTKAEYQAVFQATETNGKRPDLLVFRAADHERLNNAYQTANGEPLIDHLEETADAVIPDALISAAVAAVEVENSVWYGKLMPHYGKPSPRAFKGTPYDGIGFTASCTMPNIFMKSDDLTRLRAWRERHGVALLVAAFFFDVCYLLDLSRAERAIAEGYLKPKPQTFNARETRDVYRIWYTLATPFGDVVEPPEVRPELVVHANGKVDADTSINGGSWSLTSDAGALLHSLAQRQWPEPLSSGSDERVDALPHGGEGLGQQATAA